LVQDIEEKKEALSLITNHMAKERWEQSRTVSKIELQSTKVIKVNIESASVKERNEGVKDDKNDIENKDLCQSIWAGVVPIKTIYGIPQTESYIKADIPDNIKNLK
jgi:hypothetical protein